MNGVENYNLCSSAWGALRDGEGNLSLFPGLIRKIIQERAWERRQLPNGQVVELRNLAELITTAPMEGWGEDPKKVEAVIRDDAEVLADFREAMKQQGGDRKSEEAKSNHNNVMVRSEAQGNTRAYTLSRLKRESPDLFKRVCDGELSASAAAIEAGFRRPTSTFRTDDADAAVKTLLRHYTPSEVERALKAHTDALEPPHA